ncbi:RNA polymerase sigma factor [Frigoriglobus tundricola]|uniref:ECF RNA polymerase sigma factor SigE n=1 Tax=Frigoriglobus tundricola TaxID=2774151 RepID=A0A6M5YIX5_9BACT|nr:RNA polymerase sigma factor [Frigoriglobus tundricola]QJW92922.1 hypothetical protein FTUN_0419 [Frigoriglobus tundricola]
MAQSALAVFLKAIGPTDSRSTDDQLLAEFFAHRDDRAFAALVRRHERTVWGVCRRVLSNAADAEDAFQATFLVLVCRGRTLAERGCVGGWLYRVAHRVSLQMRSQANKRKRREERAARVESAAPAAQDPSDLLAVIGEELDRLPESHRAAVVVCDLDGLSRAAAAARLGCNEGTLSARLHRGRKQLADRLRQRGITAPLAGLVALAGVTQSAPAGVAKGTVAVAAVVAARGISDRAVSASVAALVSNTLTGMTMRFATKVLTVAVLTTGLVGWGLFGGTSGEPRASAAPVPPAKADGPVELPGPAYELLRHRKVLKELKCTPEQRVQIEDAYDDLNEKRPPFPITHFIQGNPANPQPIEQQIEAEVRKIAANAEAESRSIADKHLRKEQLVRLGQIELQVRGLRAFTDPKVAAALKLTDEQKKAAADAFEASKLGDPSAPVPGVGAGAFGRAIVIGAPPLDPKRSKKEQAKFVTGLTKEQQATWQALTGTQIGFELMPPAGHYLSTTAITVPAVPAGVQVMPALPAAPAAPVMPALPLVPPAPVSPEKN